MAKSIVINPSHEYVSPRGVNMTVAEALAWANENETDKDGSPRFTPADLLCYAVARLMALNKDGARYASGALASRIYAPRAKVESAPAAAAPTVEAFKEAMRGIIAAAHAPKRARKAAAKVEKAAPVKHARKAAEKVEKVEKPAPVKAKGPTVRKLRAVPTPPAE